MRFAKARGNNKPTVTLTETDILDACRDLLKAQGYSLGSISYICIPSRDAEDKLGRKRRRGIEVKMEIDGFQEPE